MRSSSKEDVRRRFMDQGVDPVGGTPVAIRRSDSATEIQKWARVVKDANIQPEDVSCRWVGEREPTMDRGE